MADSESMPIIGRLVRHPALWGFSVCGVLLAAIEVAGIQSVPIAEWILFAGWISTCAELVILFLGCRYLRRYESSCTLAASCLCGLAFVYLGAWLSVIKTQQELGDFHFPRLTEQSEQAVPPTSTTKNDAKQKHLERKHQMPEQSDVLKIRSDARSLINSLYGAMTQYDSDVEHWIEMGRHGEKGPHDMIGVVTKQFMDRYISDYRVDVMNTQRQLLGHIQEVPKRNPDIERIYQMCFTSPYPNPRGIGEEIFDLRLLLNEMEREHGLPLSGTQLKFPVTIGSQ